LASFLVAAAGSFLGLATVAGTAVWYWTTIVPDLYEDDSVLPVVAFFSASALACCLVLVGAWRRWRGHKDGLPAMIVGDAVLGGAIIATLTTLGVLLMPALLLATLSSALPGRRPSTAMTSS